MNDQLIYKDNKDKCKGYIHRDGSYFKKLRIGSLKKIKVNVKEMFSDQNYKQECPQYYTITME